ncbi:Por secretion system C-terminal sorting domain-containing protein [Dyadobacter sp. SG02]|uniref:PQQ-dependent sugar dehydrogenase n=1 Tax=Dyadobacter sp. SG02 TaxID=1855291 RepID=UPI0008CC30A5|nr:PQQ-dependent sugar dehydrogenase [Dyadobacter sp. SG02]SEI84389.1 Por secretion system C-terminal sorting domain-containing protein [Dyadobacter sp. SG02]
MKHINHYQILRGHALVFCFILAATRIFAQIPDVYLNSTPVITGLTSAMEIVHAGDNSNRIFIAERSGVITVFNPGALTTPIQFLNMNSGGQVVDATGEGGLLSVAFHPDFSVNGFIYTYYTDTNGDLVLARYTSANPLGNVVPANTRVEILKIPHPIESNHNGGELHFGYEDGYLYLSTGDGGSGYDPNANGQNTNSLLGKILRIDVNPPIGSGLPYVIPPSNPFGNAIYALGLRNPFRWSFDRETYAMWIGDVGQGSFEEVNFRTAGNASGANFGWRCFEGNGYTPGIAINECPDSASFVKPIYTYPTGNARGRSVIGGVVYRGNAWPVMKGYYIGMDYFSGDIHKINSDGSVKEYQTSTVTGVRDIGEDEAGEIYAVTATAVYRIEAEDPLPVTLVDFTGAPSAEGVRLAWQTSMEKDFKSFDIQFSRDARQFEAIGSIQGANAPAGNLYSFTHSTVENGDLYYRLKMTDTDESFRYSKIITVNRDGERPGDLFVRPSLISSNEMNLLVEEAFQTVEIVNAGGKVVLTEKIGGRSGPVNIPLGNTASGIYVVRMAGHDRVVQQKVLVWR